MTIRKIALVACCTTMLSSAPASFAEDKDDKVLANQKTIIANQEKILGNQKTIMENQKKLDLIIANQKKLDQIIANQKTIMSNQSAKGAAK